MTTAAIITLCVILLAIVLFATEALPVDVVAILILVVLVLSGVLTPQEGIEGFSNKATITVAFMFVLSAALLKTGALQVLAHRHLRDIGNTDHLLMHQLIQHTIDFNRLLNRSHPHRTSA